MEMSEFLALASTNCMSVFLICIKNRCGELSGNIVNFYLKEPVAFCGILDMALKIDILCTRLSRPMATTEMRFLDEHMRKTYEKQMLNQVYAPLKTCSDIQEMDKFMSLAAKAYETLVIEIHQRQFSSMQGRIKGKCSGGNGVSFRSALELMRMLREYEYMRNEKNKNRGYNGNTRKEQETVETP